jgi:hypothetical protein
MKRASILFSIIVMITISGCQPSDEQIKQAIGETQTAIAKLTPTLTNTPEYTNTPIITNTPEPTITPTPDLRVIAGDPQDFLLVQDDLPKEAKYYLPYSSWIQRDSNTEIVQDWGTELGQEYIAKSERIDGWSKSYLRGSTTIKVPRVVSCDVVKYKTSEGALLSHLEYNSLVQPSRTSDLEWIKSTDVFPELSDQALAYYVEVYNGDGEKEIEYHVEDTYFNFLVNCYSYSVKEDIDPTFTGNLVSIIINKLKNEPLVSPETTF